MTQSAPIKVGFFFIFGVATLLIVYELLGGFELFSSGVSYTTTFQSTNGLRVGDPVRLSGMDVGSIAGLRVADQAIEVELRVAPDAVIRADSVATVKFTSLLGSNFVDITFGSASAPALPPGSRIASKEGADLNTIVAQAQELTTSLSNQLGSLMGDQEGGLKNTMTNINGLVDDIRSGKGTLGKLVTDESLYNELQGSFENLNVVTQKMVSGEGTLGRLATDETLYVRLTETMEGVHEITQKISAGEGTLGKLVTDDSLFVETKELATSLNAILKKVEKGEGTLGRLVMDDTLYDEATEALRKLAKTSDTAEDLAPLASALAIGAILF